MTQRLYILSTEERAVIAEALYGYQYDNKLTRMIGEALARRIATAPSVEIIEVEADPATTQLGLPWNA